MSTNIQCLDRKSKLSSCAVSIKADTPYLKLEDVEDDIKITKCNKPVS